MKTLMKKRSNENISISFVAVVDELDFPFLLRDCFFANDAVDVDRVIFIRKTRNQSL